MSDKHKFARGARPSPRHRLAAATPHELKPVKLQVAYVPERLSYWLNNVDGDCVTAEEAFNKAAQGIFIEDNTVYYWAKKRHFLHGATLTDVMDAMEDDGFEQGGIVIGDGGYESVDYSNEQLLRSALSIAPVKIGIDADALPNGAGQGNGWYGFGGYPGQFRNEDHCVALCGYGPAAWLFEQLGKPLPAGVDGAKLCYLLFTWNSIGLVDHDWIMSTCGEAWVRNPSTIVDGKALPNPGENGTDC